MFLNKRPLYLYLFTTFLFLLTIAPASVANEVDGALAGTITDAQGTPLAGVNVYMPQLERGTSTNAEGRYRLSGVPTGTYLISFSYIGFGSQSKRVTIAEGQTARVNVSLSQQSLNIETITVTGTASATDLFTAPADVDVISGDDKFASQQASLGASLDELSGVSTISTGSQIGKPVIRGLSGNRVRVLDDGTAMDYQQYGVRHGPNVDPFLAERIEVVRGAASVQYGSDALGGAVNVISNQVPNAIGGKSFVDGQLLGEFDANNQEWTSGLHLDGASGGFGFTGTLLRRTAGNIHVPDIATFDESGNPGDPRFTDELDNTDYEQLNGSLAAGYQGSFGRIKAEYTRWQNEHNFLLPNGRGLGQNLENDTFKMNGNFPLGNNFILKPEFSFVRNLRQSNAGGGNAEPRSELPDDGPAFLDILLDSYTSKLDMEHPAVGPFSGTVGLEYLRQDQHTRGTGEPLVPSGSVDNLSAFVFEEAGLGDFTLSVGARIDHRIQHADPNEELNLPNFAAGETDAVLDQTYTNFSGSVGASYLITPNFTVASNISRGFRAPSLFNLHVDGVHGGVAAYQRGNPNLDPEKSLNTDLSFRWRSGRLNAKVTGYRNAINGYIFLVNTGEFAGPNGDGPPILESTQGDARLYGFDGSVTAQLMPWLQASSTFEYVYGENVDDDIPNVDRLPLLPVNTVGGGLKFMGHNWQSVQDPFIRVSVKHAFEQDAAGRYEPFWQFGPAFPFGRASTDAYTLVNLSAGFKVNFWNRPISVGLRADNLFNEAYRDFLDTYKGYALSPGRSVSARVKIPFGIL